MTSIAHYQVLVDRSLARYTSYLTMIHAVRVWLLCGMGADVCILLFDGWEDVLVGTTDTLVCGIGSADVRILLFGRDKGVLVETSGTCY